MTRAPIRPPRSLLDPAFRYTNSASTDLRKTFARVRREAARQAADQAVAVASAPADGEVLLFGALARPGP